MVEVPEVGAKERSDRMITPIWTMKISEIVERHEDLLVSADDIKELAKNERVKAIEEFAEALKKELNEYDFWKYDIITDLGIMETNVSRDYIVDEIAMKLKGEQP